MNSPQTLTAKQARFVTEYRKDGNATQAARRAGYHPKMAAKLVAHRRIATLIATTGSSATRSASNRTRRGALTKSASARNLPRTNVPIIMSAEETTAYQLAARQRFQAPPCRCLPCQTAGVSDRPIRFVPNELADGERDQMTRAGHWAHGAELARWYAARDQFFRLSKRHRLEAIRLRMAIVEGPEWATPEHASTTTRAC